MARKSSEKNLVFDHFNTKPKKSKDDTRRASRHPLWVNDMHRGNQCLTVPQVNTNVQDITKNLYGFT